MIAVPPDMDSVIKRWFPAGVDLIEAGSRAEPSGVHFLGVGGAGVSTVETELDAMSSSSMHRARDAASAAVVVFVLDASAPLGRRALADLAPVLESTTVAIVVNKIDVHRGWRDVQRAVAQSVDDVVPRAVEVSFFPTAAKLAERSRVAIDPRMRESLMKDSGMDALLDFVAEGMARSPALLRERTFDSAVRAAAVGARREIVDKARSVTSASTTVGLRAERARLAELRDRVRTERSAALRSRLALVRAETVHELGEAVRAFVASARDSIDKADRSELRHLQSHLTEGLDVVAADVESRLARRLAAIDADLGLDADLPPTDAMGLERSEPPPRGRGLEDKMMVLVGASAGVGLGRIVVSPLSMLPALDIAVIPISLALGALCAWWLVGSRRLVADRAHLRGWIADAAVSSKSALESHALGRILAAETALTAAVHETSKSTALSAETELQRVETELRAAAEHRAGVLAACDRDLMALERGLEKLGLATRPRRPTGSAEGTAPAAAASEQMSDSKASR